MPYIRDIRFDHVPKDAGFICDRCGEYITNVYTVTYDNGLKASYGIECFNKLRKHSNLTAAGNTLLNKVLKDIKYYSELEDIWESITSYEDAKEKQVPLLGKMNLGLAMFDTYEAWEGASFEEFKDFMIKSTQKDLEKKKEVLKDLRT